MRWALSCTNHSEGLHGELVCVTWRSRREAFSRGILRRLGVAFVTCGNVFVTCGNALAMVA